MNAVSDTMVLAWIKEQITYPSVSEFCLMYGREALPILADLIESGKVRSLPGDCYQAIKKRRAKKHDARLT